MNWADYESAVGTGRFLVRQYGDALRYRNTHPLTRLATMRSLNNATRELEVQVVRYARETGATWADVGRALGITRQGARQRFQRHMPDPEDTKVGRVAVMVAGTTIWTEGPDS